MADVHDDAPATSVPATADEVFAEIEALLSRHRDLMEKCVRLGGADPAQFIDKGIPQSQLFMVEIIPYIHRYYFNAPTNVRKTVLDVGPQSFGGTRLLCEIHGNDTQNKLKLDVSALDVVDSFRFLQKMMVPDIEFLIQDLYSIKNRIWDFLICSHVIEHVPNPIKFIRQAQSLAKDFIIVACPWNESPLVTRGHINTINKDFVHAVGGKDLDIYTNYMWGKKREVCIFTLDGRGKA